MAALHDADLERAFDKAVARCPSQLWSSRALLGGRPSEIVYVGNRLRDQLGPTFAHLVEGSLVGQAGSALRIWDRNATGGARPQAPNAADWQWSGEGWEASGYCNSRFIREERPNSIFWLDRARARVTAMYDDASRLTLIERGRPIQRLMTMLCRSLGLVEVHAALVSFEGRGVLIVGARGRGKTTTSLDCLFGGFEFLGDDSVCFAQTQDGVFAGYSLYGSARVAPPLIDRWAQHRLAWLPAGPEDEKALLLPAVSFPDQMVRETRIVAIVSPVISSAGFRSAPMPRREVFEALGWDSRTVRRFRHNAHEFAQIAALSKTLPCYRIEVGADSNAVAHGIAALVG